MIANDQSAPLMLVVGLLVLLGSMYFAVLSSRKTKRTWSTLAATAGFTLLALIINGLSFFGLPDWRLEAMALAATGLVEVLLLSCICLAQAGRLGRRGRRMPLEVVARRPRLQAVLAAAPVCLLTSWLVASGIHLIWPAPVLEVFDPAPPHLLLAFLISGLPEAAYFALAGWVFLKTYGSNVPTRTLRIKNFSFSAGCFAWLFLVINATTETAVRVFAPDGTREQIVAVHVAIEHVLTLVSLVAFGLGLTLRYVPAVGHAVVRSLPDLLILRDRLETRRWHLVNAGKVRRLVQATHHAAGAAAELGLPEEELEKRLNTLELTALLADRQIEPDRRMTPEVLRDLRNLHQEVLNEGGLVSRVRWPKTWGGAKPEMESLASATLNDALDAALALTEPPSAGVDAQYRRSSGPNPLANHDWYNLAAVAATGAGFVPEPGPGRPTAQSFRYRQALRAYQITQKAASESHVASGS